MGVILARIMEGLRKCYMDSCIDSIIQRTSLENYLMPTSPHEKLLQAVFGTRNPRDLVEPILLGYLAEGIKDGRPTSVAVAGLNVSATIVERIKNGDLHMTPSKRWVVDKTLMYLAKEQGWIIRRRFGIVGKPSEVKELSRELRYAPNQVSKLEGDAVIYLRQDDKLKLVYGLLSDSEAAAIARRMS
jgi:hypothetical protein